jgi:hypothetical protein
MSAFGSTTGSIGQSLFGGPNSQQQSQQPQQQMQNPFMQPSGGGFGNNNSLQQYQQQYQQGPFGGDFGQQQMQNPFMQSSGGGFSQQQMPAYAQDYMNTMNNFKGMDMGGGYGGQQGGYGPFVGGFGPMPQQGGFGPNANNFGAPQGMGQIPKFANPFSQQMQPQQTQQPQQMLTRRQQRRADRLAKRNPAPASAPAPAPVDFSKMSQAGQFGDQGFAQTLRDFAGQQYKDYAYNPGDQTFYKGGDKASQGVGLGQVLQQGRAAGYKMANGGIAALRRKGK